MKYGLCLAAMFCALAPAIFAMEITGIYVSGLGRTQPHIVETPLQRFIGRDAQDVDVNEVHAVIGDLGVLELLEIEMQYNDDSSGKILAVTVR